VSRLGRIARGVAAGSRRAGEQPPDTQDLREDLERLEGVVAELIPTIEALRRAIDQAESRTNESVRAIEAGLASLKSPRRR
jgi:hypothetical protein